MRKIILIFCVILLIVIFIGRSGVLSSAFTVELTEGSVDEGFAYSNLYPPRIRTGNITSSEITIAWDFERKKLVSKRGLDYRCAELSGFRIYRDGFWFTDVPKDRRSITDTGLFPGTSYKYKVVALTFDNRVEGEVSEEIEVETLAGDPNPIINFPKKRHEVFLAEGASVAEGYGIGRVGCWVDQVAQYLTEHGSVGLETYNRAVRSSLSGDVAGRIGRELAGYNPDLVIVDTAGINDLTPALGLLATVRGNLSLADFRTNVEKIIELVHPSDERTLILMNINYFDCCWREGSNARNHEKRVVWNKMIRDIANEHGLILVDVETPLENGGIALLGAKPGDPLEHQHPTIAGHTVMAEVVIEAIERYKR